MTTISIDPGNSLAEALDVGLLNHNFQYSNWVGNTDRRDIFKFSTHQVGDLEYSLTGLYNNANIQILDSEGNMIGGAFKDGLEDEFNTYNNLAAGDYYLKVYGVNTTYNLNFKLNLNNAGDTLAQAQDIGSIYQPKHIMGSVNPSDRRDIYKFSTHQVGDLDFSLTGLSNNANIQLLDSEENLISGSYNTGTQDESNIHENLVPGDYYFKVYSSSGTSYELDFELIPDITEIYGSEGDDTLIGEDRNELIVAKAGNDIIKGYGGNDTIYGGNDSDLINGGDGRDLIYGQHGDDYFVGGNDNDTLYGGNGNDTILGQLNNDVVYGGSGHDNLYGVEGNDFLVGEDGDDTLQGGIGDDTLKGGNGNNLLRGDNGNDLLIGGQIKDSMHSGSGNDKLYGYGGQDFMSGGDGHDKLYGGDDHDQMYGDDGNDLLSGENGIDFMYGGEGRDKLYGGNDRDYLFGDEGNDTLYGDEGNDKLRGGDNNDILIGGSGNDTLIGGLHRDIFLYDTGTSFNTNAIGVDTIEDFARNQDRIYLDKTTFTAISSRQGDGFSKSSEFAVVNLNSQVASSNAFIVFSKETGDLFYNQNGSASGMGSGAHFATLFDVDRLVPEDFILVD